MPQSVGDEVTRALRALERQRDELSNAYAALIGKRPTPEVMKLAGAVKESAESVYREVEREWRNGSI